MPAIRGSKSKKKTRRYARDVDQVHADLASARHLERYLESKPAEDLPALGQHYCVHCAKWYDSEYNYDGHLRGKPHKRRLKQLKEEPHTQKEAELAIGLRTDNGKRKTEEATMELDT